MIPIFELRKIQNNATAHGYWGLQFAIQVEDNQTVYIISGTRMEYDCEFEERTEKEERAEYERLKKKFGE
jgi:hypothetical protein